MRTYRSVVAAFATIGMCDKRGKTIRHQRGAACRRFLRTAVSARYWPRDGLPVSHTSHTRERLSSGAGAVFHVTSFVRVPVPVNVHALPSSLASSSRKAEEDESVYVHVYAYVHGHAHGHVNYTYTRTGSTARPLSHNRAVAHTARTPRALSIAMAFGFILRRTP
jgi:hypothetical protein